MKNSVIICEGTTDGVLLQYLMEKVGGWKYSNGAPRLKHRRSGMPKDEWVHLLSRNDDSLTITSAGTNSELIPVFEKALKRSKNAGSDDERFADIVLLTDRDEDETERRILEKVAAELSNCGASSTGQLQHNQWNDCSMKTSTDESFRFRVLVLVIPFTENGALETFLLDAISADSAAGDSYDKTIIDKGNVFVDTIDPKHKYLTQRRHITKAKFDVYFCVRTPAEQFAERQNILKMIPWDNYKMIQQDFVLLEDI